MAAPSAETVSNVADPAASITALAAGWASAAGATVQSTTRLAVAETRLALISVLAMMLVAALAAACLLGGWGLLVAALVYALVQLGVATSTALAALGAVHFITAFLLWRYVAHLSCNLNFPHTRRHLAGSNDNVDR